MRERLARAKPCSKRQQSFRQARRTIAWALFVFGSLQGALALQLTFGDWRYQDRTYDCRLSHVRCRLANNRDQANPPSLALFLGSSAVAYGVNGEAFQEEMSKATGRSWIGCNVAALASGPLLEMVYLRRVLDEGIRPQLVVGEVHPLSVSDNVLDTLTLLRRSGERFGVKDLERLERCGMSEIEDCRQHRLRDLLFPCYAHRFAILAAHAVRFMPPGRNDSWAEIAGDATGWVRLAECPQQEHDALWQKMAAMYAESLHTLRLVPAENNAIRDLVRCCQAEGITVAILVSPWAAEFDTAWWSREARQNFAAVLDGLRQDLKVPVIDARTWMVDDVFYDPVHLGEVGADLYTRKLVRDCLVPIYRQSPSTPAMQVAHRLSSAKSIVARSSQAE